jgi:glyoxylase-like metal-dependent hydrolase (beta-lactamase superfamily II)
MPFLSRHTPCLKQPHLKSSPHTSTATPVPMISKLRFPIVHPIYEPTSGTWQYLVADPETLQAIVIDSVLDYNSSKQTISTSTADSLLSTIAQHGYTITKILETHAHADHLTAAAYMQHRLEQTQGFKPPIGIGKRIVRVQEMFGKRYGVPDVEWQGAFDELFEDGEEFAHGKMRVEVVHLPGHTPDHVGYVVGGESNATFRID